MEAFAGSENLQLEPSVPVENQCNSHTFASSPSLINDKKAAISHELHLPMYDSNVVAVDMHNFRSNELVEVPVTVDVAVAESHHSDRMDSGTQDINKVIGPSRSWEDGYNWRKYGQKHIKGNEFPRSYYKCSHLNCKVKKQVEQSHDGRITDVIYRGNHDHPKPQSISYMAADEKLNGTSSPKSTEVPSIGNGKISQELSKLNGTEELSLVVTSAIIVGENEQMNRIQDEIQDDNNPEFKRRCVNFNTEATSDSGDNNGQLKESLEAFHSRSQSFASSSLNENMTATNDSEEMTPSVIAPNPPVDAIASEPRVPFEADSEKKQGADVGLQVMESHKRGTSPSATTDRFWGDAYNWRKYGQKHIKGNEFPRSYYRCTYPNCQVKRQLEGSHDGKITDIIYKGEHNHPKPQPSSHIAVGRFLSIQEEGFKRFSSLNHPYDMSPAGQPTHNTELIGNPELCLVQTSVSYAQGERLISNSKTLDMVEHNAEHDTKSSEQVSKEMNKDTCTGFNHQQHNLSVDVRGQCKSPILVSSASVNHKNTPGTSRELTASTVSNSPVYMVTSRGIVPIEVDTESKSQRQSSTNGVESEESNPSGLSLSMTERLLENAYHWRKYGQKNIKGSEFPRSYYRCTHPNCHVKMQLERSHDGRIIEIIYKGKHDHPKPQPITRMAIGALLSLEEDRSGRILDVSGDISLNRHVQSSVSTNLNPILELSSVTPSVENVEASGKTFNRNVDEVEDENDTKLKRRKIDIGDVDHNPVIRTPREPRIVVETLSDFDVVDDGYRWQKYGRKIVKGNSYPRNYYRCSNGGCLVKKHVERAANNPKAVITTYEGKHNHDIPLGRITAHDTVGIIINTNGANDPLGVGSGEFAANNTDAGVFTNASPEKQMCGLEDRIQGQSNSADPDATKDT